jgi:hypothetical protein
MGFTVRFLVMSVFGGIRHLNTLLVGDNYDLSLKRIPYSSLVCKCPLEASPWNHLLADGDIPSMGKPKRVKTHHIYICAFSLAKQAWGISFLEATHLSSPRNSDDKNIASSPGVFRQADDGS